MFTREGDPGVHRHIQRRGSGPGVQPDERVCIPRGKRQPKCRPVHRGRPARTQHAWCSFRKYTLKLYDRPSAPLELKIPMLRAGVLHTMLYGCVTWSPRACHYDTLRRAHHRFLTRCIGWRKHNRADHPISYLGTLVKTGSESIEATLRRRRISGAHGGYETAEVRGVRRNGGGRGLCRGARKKSGWGVSWTISELSASTPTSGRLQPRTRGNGAERNGRARGGTFFMAKWIVAEKTRAGLRHVVVCPNVTGRTKRTAQSKRARAGSLALVD